MDALADADPSRLHDTGVRVILPAALATLADGVRRMFETVVAR